MHHGGDCRWWWSPPAARPVRRTRGRGGQGGQHAVSYVGKRHPHLAAMTIPHGRYGGEDAPGADWIADYYRRQRMGAVGYPDDAAEAPTEIIPRLTDLAAGQPPAPGPAVRGGIGTLVPRLAPGVESLGEYQGSGLAEASYLVRHPGGQVVHVSRLLYLVLSGIDGRRTVSEIAARVTAAVGRTVSVGNIEYLLTHKLAPLGLLAVGEGAGAAAAAPRQASALLGLKLRRTLIREGGVQRLAGVFRPLFSPFVVALVLACLIASDAWLFGSGRIGPAFRYVLLHPLLLLVLGLSVLSMLFHECGHAAACRYGGARPGVIGMGFYVIWPAFFTNVTDAYRLGRAGRIRTDLGGVYFNAIFILPLTGAYLATRYAPLAGAVMLIHLEIIQQLMPSLRFDGYFILADLIGVPDLFRRIGPTLRSLVPGRPADPRVTGLRRSARALLTAWVLTIVPLLFLELGFIIVQGPSLARTFARSLHAQAHAAIAQFGQADIAAGLVTAISVVLLVLPVAGICYILLRLAWSLVGHTVVATRRRPALRVLAAAVAVLIAAGLAVRWGALPLPDRTAPHPAAAGNVTVQRPSPAPPARVTPARRPGRRAVVLEPVSAAGFDALEGLQRDPSDENTDEARYAIDGDPETAWHTQYYIGNPVFGGLKTGTGLILDMGRKVRLSSVTVTFGPTPGADVSIEVGNDDTLAAATLATFATVARADGIGGTHTFTVSRPATGRYVLIWLTRLPPLGSGRFGAEIFNIIVRGSA